MSYEHTKDALDRAVHILATRPERNHERLMHAYKELRVQQIEVPSKFQKDVDNLMAHILVSEPSESGARIDAIEAMSEPEARAVADELLALERALRRA